MNRDKTFSIPATIYASKECIWKVLQSDQLYHAAWGANLKATWEPGSNIQFEGVWENIAYTDKGVVQDNEENHFLKYSYWSSFWNAPDTPAEYCFISYRIKPLDNRSAELTISQEGFRDEKHYDDTVTLWETTIAIIKTESEKMNLTMFNDSVFDRLISIVDSIPGDTYNTPETNGWNTAQVIEHIVMASSDLRKFFQESVVDSATPYDLHVQPIREMMLNNKVKLKTLDFLVPPNKTFDKKLHRETLIKLQAEINYCIGTLDLKAKCMAFELPPFGYMSVFEWLNFTVYHAARHTTQIEAIRKLDKSNQSRLS